jgi:putative DNA primase/helicase
METIPEIEIEPNGSLPYKPDDDQLTVAMAEEWEGSKSYFHSAWYVYEIGCWVHWDIQEIKRAIRFFMRKHRQVLPHGVSQARVNAITAMLEDDLFVADRRLIMLQKQSEKYINLRNGLFNLETFKLEPHNPDLYMTTQLDFAYDPTADCPTFKRFLQTSLTDSEGTPDKKMIMLVQEALAYSMTARTDLKASFWLVGQPDSGKSTLIAFIRSLMGSLHSTIDLNQLGSNRFLLSGIVDKRVVTFTEADTNLFIPDALYKAMVGGQDELYVDVKNKDGITFVPSAKFWWAMNSAPRINDRSGATLNRLRIILFDRTVPQEERISNLSDLLAEEKPGVFNWLMLGYRRLVKNGTFTEPVRSEYWREVYRKENDAEGNFSEECLDFSPAMSVQSKDLYRAYKSWCDDNGHRAKNITNVAREWRRLGLEDRRNNGRTLWHGAALKPVL